MKTFRSSVGLVAAGWMLALVSGCQTWVPEAGLTLPSWRYLNHQPTYIAPSPEYPLPRELNSNDEAWQRLQTGAVRPIAVGN